MRQEVTRIDYDLLEDRLGDFSFKYPSCLGYYLGVIETYKYFLNDWIKNIDSVALFKNDICREEASGKFPLFCHQMFFPFSVLKLAVFYFLWWVKIWPVFSGCAPLWSMFLT